MTKKESIIILFSITLCWSSSYVFIKDIPQNFSVYAYLALTSGVAGIILAFVMRRKLKLLNSVSLRQGHGDHHRADHPDLQEEISVKK